MKSYEYRVYTQSGSYIGNLSDVIDRHPSFNLSINGGVGALTLSLARKREDMNSCDDAVVGNEVRIVEQSGGTQIYSGEINRVSMSMDQDGKSNVRVEVVGYVSTFARRIVEDGDGDTGLQALSSDPSDMFEDVIGLYDGKITAGTITTSGITADCVWNASSISEAIGNILDRLPNNWCWYVDGENKAHLKSADTGTINHTLIVGREIGEIETSISLDSVVNDVRVIGGTPDGQEQVFGRVYNSSSLDNFGKSQVVVSDGRIYDPNSVAYVAASNMNEVPIGEATFTVYDNEYSERGYDIESIHPGDVILVHDTATKLTSIWGEDDWGDMWWGGHPNDVLSQPLIVTNIEYMGNNARITACDVLTKGQKNLETVKRNLEAFQRDKAPISTTV